MGRASFFFGTNPRIHPTHLGSCTPHSHTKLICIELGCVSHDLQTHCIRQPLDLLQLRDGMMWHASKKAFGEKFTGFMFARFGGLDTSRYFI
jgi:hypothetical protein